jgi:protocatechuate 3,4-dioxygenase, alpha subunit
MSRGEVRIPTGSQTFGPYFRIGLECLMERTPATTVDPAGAIEIHGRVLDRDGAPVPDAMLEFWSTAKVADKADVFPAGFRRAATDGDGSYSVVMQRPTVATYREERAHPHMLVLVFARGLMRHLISRVYFDDEQANESDPVLAAIPEERRATLIAQRDESRTNVYQWDVILQGAGETVFFAW